jgi:hypothetical protein
VEFSQKTLTTYPCFEVAKGRWGWHSLSYGRDGGEAMSRSVESRANDSAGISALFLEERSQPRRDFELIIGEIGASGPRRVVGSRVWASMGLCSEERTTITDFRQPCCSVGGDDCSRVNCGARAEGFPEKPNPWTCRARVNKVEVLNVEQLCSSVWTVQKAETEKQ